MGSYNFVDFVVGSEVVYNLCVGVCQKLVLLFCLLFFVEKDFYIVFQECKCDLRQRNLFMIIKNVFFVKK